MPRRPSSIRSKIILALLVPVVALTALWTVDVTSSIGDVNALRDTFNTRDNVSLPCDRMVSALQAERSRSVEALAAGRSDGALRGQRADTDAAIAEFRTLSKRYRGSGVSAEVTRARIADMLTTLDTVVLLRTQVDARSITRAEALTGYSSVISYAFSVSTAAAASSEPLVERVIRTTVALRRAGELLHQEDAVMTGATTAGRFGTGEYRQLIEIVGTLRFQIPTAASTLPAPDQAAFKSMLSGPAFSALRTAEDQLIKDGSAGGPVSTTTTRDVWKATFIPAVRQFYGFLTNGYDKAVEFARAARERILFRFGLSGVLGLLAVLASLLLSIRIGGSVVRRLSVLRTAATDLAHRRLPDMVARLRAGERIDPDDGRLRLSLGDDEIAEVGAALTEVQRSATDSAAAEAALRYDLNRVLVNVARRNQSLIDRQLEALSRAPAGGEAATLVEQLAVRMRRHAEHLVILAGSARSRRGLGPEPLAGIIARVAAEIEHGERIQSGVMVDAEVPERAVADVGHVLAELLENAVMFSPVETPVRVTGYRVADGVVVEIEDQGVGMSPSALDETNRTLAQPQEFDPAKSARLGLLVVAVLAAQRGIRVSLQAGAHRGVIARVSIPDELVTPITRVIAGAVGPAAGRRRADASRLVGMASRAGRGRGGPRHSADDPPSL